VEDTARRFCGTLVGDGRPGPIEERIGRRLVRLVDPQSDEGVSLLADGRVELVGPDGEALGNVEIQEAYRRLRERLERRLAEVHTDDRDGGLREGLDRLNDWSRRMVRERERST
jgi:hypothetical protein